MPERIRCCVPFCRHTRGQRKGEEPIGPGAEWVCGEHWAMVPKYLRRRKAKLYGAYRRRFGKNAPWEYPAGSDQRIEAVRIDTMCRKIWDRCKAAAIEAAGGI